MSTTGLSLYRLEEELATLLDTLPLVEQAEDQAALLSILDDIAEAREEAIEKRDRLIGLLRHIDHQVAGITNEIDRLKKLKEHYESSETRIKHYVAGVMERFVEKPKKGQRKLEGSLGILRYRDASPSVKILDESLIPAEFWGEENLPCRHGARHQCWIDKIAIRQAIKAGREVPGADLEFGSPTIQVA